MFGSHTPQASKPGGGVTPEQHRFEFANGFGASVIRGPYSYGGPEGHWELAVLDETGDISYDTPITSDVIGWLSEDDVARHLDAIAALAPESIIEAKLAREREERDERIAELEAELARLRAEQVSA